MRKNMRRNKVLGLGLSAGLILTGLSFGAPFSMDAGAKSQDALEDVVTLRVCNWEEYIDEGGWDEEEVINLESGDIIGTNSMVEDFEEWYYETYGKRVEVEYCCFGTNEELYNMLTLGDEYDLVCPSDYMIMKLLAEGWLTPFSDRFFDASLAENYYVRGVSPFIKDTFAEIDIEGYSWDRYAAGYMWGTTGVLYNPDEVDREDASTWTIFTNPDFYRQVTLKDNVRDTMFAAVGAVKKDLYLSESFRNSADYHARLTAEMNDVSKANVDAVEAFLKEAKNNVYSFETDSGKADMITGKVLANYQWSGDAVYAMDQAEEDDFYLEFAVPKECTNLWFDGWCMLKNRVEKNPEKQAAAEAFVNFLSRPDNAVRNMYYIGYTSVIAGDGEDDRVYEYLTWNYEADEDADEEELVEYSVGNFFTGDPEDEDYIFTTYEDQTRRQLYAQYPPMEVLERTAIMHYFDEEATVRVNQMWINIRCFSIAEVPVWGWCLFGLLMAGLAWLVLKVRKLS